MRGTADTHSVLYVGHTLVFCFLTFSYHFVKLPIYVPVTEKLANQFPCILNILNFSKNRSLLLPTRDISIYQHSTERQLQRRNTQPLRSLDWRSSTETFAQ